MFCKQSIKISANLQKIETVLGHSLSPNMIDPFTLKDNLLTPDQLNRICTNIQRIEFIIVFGNKLRQLFTEGFDLIPCAEYNYIFGYYNTIRVNSFTPHGLPPAKMRTVFMDGVAA